MKARFLFISKRIFLLPYAIQHVVSFWHPNTKGHFNFFIIAFACNTTFNGFIPLHFNGPSNLGLFVDNICRVVFSIFNLLRNLQNINYYTMFHTFVWALGCTYCNAGSPNIEMAMTSQALPRDPVSNNVNQADVHFWNSPLFIFQRAFFYVHIFDVR